MRSSKSDISAEQREYTWHAKDASAVLADLGSTEEGLATEEVEARRKKNGPNQFSEKKKWSFFSQLISQFKSPFAIVLLVAALITFGLEEFVDTVVILFALSIAIVVGVIQEGRASSAFDKLARSQIHTAIVMRDGARHEVTATELVPGDVVLLQTGKQVPADMRLIEAKNLSINEAVLTGEWRATDKSIESVDVGVPFAERSSMAWKGTFVAEGYGMGVVTATGDNTEVGKIAAELAHIEGSKTPLQWQIARVSRTMFFIILVLVVVIFALGIFRGEALETMLIMVIAIAVASIPEGLPAAVTIVLAIGMESLLKRGGLVRSLLAAETLGSTTYVLTDKTGTLTEGRMALTNVVYSGAKRLENHADMAHIDTEIVQRIMNAALSASDAFIEDVEGTEEGKDTLAVHGEPMERAILEAGINLMRGQNMRAARVDYLSFTSENRLAAGLCAVDGKHVLYVNGVPEYLLESAEALYTTDGVVAMSDDRRRNFQNMITRLTKEGKRVIATGYRAHEDNTIPEDPEDILEGKFVFLGLLVFYDPVRSDVREAIKGVMGAGAQVRLVTGDNPQTALSIAREVGIASENDVALTGKDIAQFSDKELFDVIQTTRVFARVLPRQKLRIAQILQSHGEIVAMTGDGVNDAPALQKANIGVALGSGTEVAKEAADLVLVNDTFATIYAAIEEGRRIIGNLRKIIGYLLATSLSEAVLISAALIVSAPIPILPVQILWANIIEEGLMSVAFAFDKGDKRAMKQKPQDIHTEGILSRQMLMFIGLVVGVLSAFLLGLYFYLLSIDMPIETLRSIMFVIVSVDSLFIAFSFRSLTTPVWKIPLIKNVFFILSFIISAAMLGLALTIPFLQQVLSYEPLPGTYLALIAVYGFISMIVIEIGKWMFFERIHGK